MKTIDKQKIIPLLRSPPSYNKYLKYITKIKNRRYQTKYLQIKDKAVIDNNYKIQILLSAE